jgi:hypothetical protein
MLQKDLVEFQKIAILAGLKLYFEVTKEIHI